jgi:hypothetical protein
MTGNKSLPPCVLGDTRCVRAALDPDRAPAPEDPSYVSSLSLATAAGSPMPSRQAKSSRRRVPNNAVRITRMADLVPTVSSVRAIEQWVIDQLSLSWLGRTSPSQV